MTNELKRAYYDKFQAHFKEVGAKFDIIKARATRGFADLRIDFHTRYEAWQKKKNDLKAKIQD